MSDKVLSKEESFQKIDYDQLKLLIRPGDIIYGNQDNQFPGHIAIIVSDNNDLVVREAYPVPQGVDNISLKDFCECGGYHTQFIKYKKSEQYDNIKILRADCAKEQAEMAAEQAKKLNGPYDWSYLEDLIGFFASLAIAPPFLIPGIIKALIFATDMKTKWKSDKLWYCSKFVYMAYRKAGFDLCPKRGKCPGLSPLQALKKGDFPHLYDKNLKFIFNGKCPWPAIAPSHLLQSNHVQVIWEWRDPTRMKALPAGSSPFIASTGADDNGSTYIYYIDRQ